MRIKDMGYWILKVIRVTTTYYSDLKINFDNYNFNFFGFIFLYIDSYNVSMLDI